MQMIHEENFYEETVVFLSLLYDAGRLDNGLNVKRHDDRALLQESLKQYPRLRGYFYKYSSHLPAQ